MTKREVVHAVLRHERPPYVPWSFRFTREAKDTLAQYLGVPDPQCMLDNHLVELGSDIGFFTDLGIDQFRDVFGVVWDRSVDKDIGIVRGCVLPEPTLRDYDFPDPLDRRFYGDIPDKLARYPDCFRVFCLGFSLFERAWTMRGLETLLLDFYDHPEFVRELLNAIADYNIAQVKEALEYDIDAVYFGDDWGQQHGLIMGYPLWREYLYPVLQRMYDAVRAAGKRVVIHCCGDVDELFDDLVKLGVDCFNPFQPEVMDVESLLPKYRRCLSFWGGLSTQRLLPFATPAEVRRATRRLIELGTDGGYILSPAHAVEGDVPLENMLAFIEVAGRQAAFKAVSGRGIR
ncbi:MAG: uroporphyrinogen-III decarboxylase-like protein [Phycisphaerae bacterium]|nr:uroporphyrinogen-III decarboxylase-like protein [Phycisphaerae bacterium]